MRQTTITPGTILDGFLVGEQVHRGGMASLWAASHPDMPFPLLVKAPTLSEGTDPAAIVGFEMELMILPRLTGPHVPRFIAQGSTGLQPYLVMERIPGPSLLPRLTQLPLPREEVAALGARIATALDDLHRQHVVHLDVKPSNLLLRPTGEVVLIDYGLSHHDELPDLMGEEFRLPYGTAPYMAPEQVLGFRKDPRSDQFALGVLMYFFLTQAKNMTFWQVFGLASFTALMIGWPGRGAKEPMMQAVDEVNKVGLEFHDRVEEPLWFEQLRRLAVADNRNPSLSELRLNTFAALARHQAMGEHYDAWVRNLDAETDRLLAGTIDGFEPRFSPDGRWIIWYNHARLTWYRTPVGGGSVTPIVRTMGVST